MAAKPIQIVILTMFPAGLHHPAPSMAHDLHFSVFSSELTYSMKLNNLPVTSIVVITTAGPFIMVCVASAFLLAGPLGRHLSTFGFGDKRNDQPLLHYSARYYMCYIEFEL